MEITKEEMQEVVKIFLKNIDAAGVKEHLALVKSITRVVKAPECPAAVIEAVIKSLASNLDYYQYRPSQNATLELLRLMLARHRKPASSAISQSLLKVAQYQEKNVAPSRSESARSLLALSWTCLLIEVTFLDDDSVAIGAENPDWCSVVSTQSLLYYGACASRNMPVKASALRKLKRIWKKMGSKAFDEYLDALVKSGAGLSCCGILGALALFDSEAFQKRKSEYLNLFVKLVITSKTKPLQCLLDACGPALKRVTHEDFNSVLLPSIQKALLRNPEIVLPTISGVLQQMTIDLSQHGVAIVKSLASQLISKTDKCRDEAAAALGVMALEVSDAGAMEDVAKLCFSILKGSEGKLTIAGQKLTVLEAIGKLSDCPVGKGQSATALSTFVADSFSPFLLQENYEIVLIQALQALSHWCRKFTSEVPSSVLELFKKGPSLKASTFAVRAAYVECMISSFTRDTMEQAGVFLSALLQTVEKASGQALQIPAVSEAISSAFLIARLCGTELKIGEAKLNTFWSVVLDSKKRLFTSEKFLQQAPDSALLRLVAFCECLLLEHPTKMQDDKAGPYFAALVNMLLHKEWRIRQSAQKSVRKLLTSLSGNQFCSSLLTEFSNILRLAKVIDLAALDDVTEMLKTYIAPRKFENALKSILNIPGIDLDEKKASLIALKILPDCYHPCVQYVNRNVWTDFLYKANLDVVQFIKHNADVIVQKYVIACQHTDASLKVISDLVRIAPHMLVPKIMEFAGPKLRDSALVQVTNAEYSIMNTPEGELWNKAVIESGPKVAEDRNIKRENKAYSHKEQVEFMQLQKEIEAKKALKGGGGGAKGPGGPKSGASQPLSKKQRELMEIELQKESEIRRKLMQLNESVRAVFLSLDTCVNQQNAQALARYVPDIVELILPLLSSHLTSKIAQNLFVSLRKAVECDALSLLDIQVAYVTLRLYSPAAEVDTRWCEEDLDLCVVRILSRLQTVTKKEKLTSPCFSYIFPFLELVLRDAGSKVKGAENVMISALKLLHYHAKGRPEPGVHEDDGPQYLPRHRMLECLRHLIGTTTVNVQKYACEAFTETCKAIASVGIGSSEMKAEIEVLLRCLLSPNVALRKAALEGLSCMVNLLPSSKSSDELASSLSRRLWVAKHDQDEECQHLADQLWTRLGFATDPTLCNLLLGDITHHEPQVQQAAAKSLHAALEENDGCAATSLQLLVNIYEEKLHQAPPVMDNLGRVVTETSPDDFQSRVGIALALRHISPVLTDDEIQPLFSFFVPDALKDRSAEVRTKMLEAALQAVDDHGKACTNTLLQVFEDFLRQAPNSESFDSVRQSVVILMGTLARHLDKKDPKVKPIVAKLTETLSTPSQPVQEAVAKCLPPLVAAIREDAPEIVRKMLVILLESENYGERKGAAYGLAGMVKGLGIIAFKQLDIMSTLTEAIQDKKNYRHREGALFAFEMFCTMLGRLFEPYVVHVLPYLLLCFGDGNQYVREAADDTARAVMKNLSAHGVKLVLPSLLSALEEDSWRTKTGSVELLGAMAFCAPKQLSSCLPSVVPRLCDIISDSHPKVQKAGQQALKQIGSVIRNPEILSITPVLLGALSDPFRKTSKCLQTLLDTKFVHFIDAPSLALIMPVVHRAFEDRSTDTRKMAAQIIGNMYSLTDQKDLNPYLQSVIPGLKNTLLDPVPDVRTVAAKALGAMVKGTGESLFEELLPWLMETLTSEQSSVDRSGSAQGLAEVLGALGVSKLEKLMPEIIRMAGSCDVLPHVRDGYIMLYIYLPMTFADDFTPFIGDIIPALLQSLADECEFLRDTALLAGQRIIGMYAQQAVTLLLPQLESGLFDDNWRIRLSSIQLLGELLYQVSGVSGKMSTHGGEDDNFGTQEGQKAISEVLGQDRCCRVYSGLYIGRSDVMLQVRQSALHVWKIVVPNTARVLRDILPTLFKLLLGCLASSSYDKRQVGGRTLGDIVRKLGERMLPEIIPILSDGMASQDADQRQGVCIGLSEIIKSCSRDAIITFSDKLVPTVRLALCDPLPDVRVAAASTFDNLHTAIGSLALEEILPSLLDSLGDPEKSEYVVDGLRQIISVKGKVVMPFIVPKLIQPPINTRVLSFLSSVAGEALTKHLTKILKALLSSLVYVSSDEALYSSTLEDCKGVVLSVEGEHGTRIIMDDLMEATKSENVGTRRAAVTLLHAFCKDTESDYGDYVAVFIRGYFKLLADVDVAVQAEAWSALSAVTKKLDAAEQLQHVSSVRQAIRFVKDDVRAHGGVLPGFCLPKKGMAPILPVFREGILNGAPDMKEQAAKGLSECIQVLTAEALKPSVVSITGPLIRILGDRFSYNVRVAVLETLTLLLEKAGIYLKPFLPQLQTTFSKALHDTNRPVRLQSATALKYLALIHTRLDPLFTDLNNNIKTEEDPVIKNTMLQALRGCIINGGTKMNPKIQNEITSTLISLLSSDEETCCKCAAGCLGSMCSVFSEDDLDGFFLQNVLVKDTSASWPLRRGRSSVLAVALKEVPERVYSGPRKDPILDALLECTSLDRVQIVTKGIHAAAYLMIHLVRAAEPIPKQVAEAFKKCFVHISNDVKVAACNSVSWAAYELNSDKATGCASNGHDGAILPDNILTSFISHLLNVAKEKNTTVRSSAESAIVTALSLRQGDHSMQKILPLLAARDANFLSELFKTKLRKLVAGKEIIEDIDDTLLTK